MLLLRAVNTRIATLIRLIGLGLIVYGILRSGTWGLVQAKPDAPEFEISFIPLAVVFRYSGQACQRFWTFRVTKPGIPDLTFSRRISGCLQDVEHGRD